MIEKIIMRPAAESDMPEIYKIEVKSFDKPFTLENLMHEFSVKFSDFIVAELENTISAYAIVWKVHDEIHLNKIAVAEENRKMGIGRAVVDYIVKTVNPGYARIILIEVRESDAGARSFYEKLNFIETGFRKNYYINDNAVLMEREIILNG